MIKVFAKSDSALDHQEIGQCRGIDIAGVDGSRYQLTENNCKEVFVDGWKIPVQPNIPMFSPINLGSQDTQKLRLIITILVQMMGGAVTIQASELEAARSALRVEVEEQRDPWMQILRVRKR